MLVLRRFLLAALAVASLALAMLVAGRPAMAHTGHEIGALASGFAHPFGGLDHLLAMLGVGVWAAQLSTDDRAALWRTPLAFVAAMVAGAAVAILGAPLPLVELGILGSVLLVGLLILAAPKALLPAWAPPALVALFAVFHGYAHGAELPDAAHPMAYGAGFVAATALLHLAGIALGLGVRRGLGAQAVRALGGLLALGGAALALAV
jgi:urease accessory protein